MEAFSSALREFMTDVPLYVKVSVGITISGTLAVMLYRKLTTKPSVFTTCIVQNFSFDNLCDIEINTLGVGLCRDKIKSTSTCFLILTEFKLLPDKNGVNIRFRKIYPSDTIVLYQIGRGPYAPSFTPFAIKLETYLRMAKIPYVNVHGRRMSAKGKVPFIEHNGVEIPDTAFCIKYINKTFNVDLNKHLNDEQRAVAHAWRKTVEENTYWVIALDRWVYNGAHKVLGFMGYPSFLQYLARSGIKKSGWGHGIGRHSQEEVYGIMEEDLKNLSAFFGTKKFLLGDQPCEEDCAVFGILSQPRWHAFGNQVEKILEGFPNLCSYCERMKETFWPDWNDCITHGGTREAIS